MDIYRETEIRIEFERGQVFTPVCVFNGIEEDLGQKTFSKDTHQVEELLDFIEYNETGGYDVYL